jgi:hypothetical protein
VHLDGERTLASIQGQWTDEPLWKELPGLKGLCGTCPPAAKRSLARIHSHRRAARQLGYEVFYPTARLGHYDHKLVVYELIIII